MGYYSDYTLQIHLGVIDIYAVLTSLNEIVGDSEAFEIEDQITIRSQEALQWYDHDEDCAELSTRFPGTVFQLHGEGSRPGDLWDAYYQDGRCQICRAVISYPKFEPAKLCTVQQAQEEDMENT